MSDKLVKADLHIHTEYSMDCDTPLERIAKRCLELGINCIAIADHGTVEGALQMQNVAPFTVIVAEEILTPHGEIMGMFLKEGIPSGLSVSETLSRIKSQGALVCIPHPFDLIRKSILNSEMVDEVIDQIDVVEIFNARSTMHRSTTQAEAFAQKYGLPGSAGSDAHTIGEIGNAYIEMPRFEDTDGFLQALAKGKVFGQKTTPLIHFRGLWTRLKKRV